jgi:hypothetical protein
MEKNMKAYLLDRRAESHVYLVFGEDCVSAAKVLAEKIGGSYEDFSVGGSWDVDPNEPIDISKLWPYFTAWPGRHASD